MLNVICTIHLNAARSAPSRSKLNERATMLLRLIWLAAGAFAIGTATFITAPLLPAMAAELSVSVPTAGHLVSVYALAYAIGSPILSTLLGDRDRKTLLAGALGAFAAANLLAAA